MLLIIGRIIQQTFSSIKLLSVKYKTITTKLDVFDANILAKHYNYAKIWYYTFYTAFVHAHSTQL